MSHVFCLHAVIFQSLLVKFGHSRQRSIYTAGTKTNVMYRLQHRRPFTNVTLGSGHRVEVIGVLGVASVYVGGRSRFVCSQKTQARTLLFNSHSSGVVLGLCMRIVHNDYMRFHSF